ncbi:UDP-N-acetylglucosamine 1-carboxyvinyltransferase 1 [bacterium HR24]|jgi:UDP-N-acetylglucosamine 1-carboxyvinyltransferase|nr:UDP-N-acetylglucosamine 1-carboxyvinyltransferase 1 [bacterium HR24]
MIPPPVTDQREKTSSRFLIDGRRALRGVVEVSGSKNAALGAMAAALLTAEDCYIENVPDIGDVRFMSDVLRSLGAQVEWAAPGVLRINAARLHDFAPPSDLVSNLRGSFLVMGALLGRSGQAACAPPGGDVIGQRPIDVHLKGFEMLGARVWREEEKFVAEARELRGARIFLDYPSVLGTQNLVLAAVRARGRTTIINAACEPEVSALAEMLNRMGARIRGAGTHTIEVEGVDELRGAVHRNIPDRIEAGTFAIAAAITGGEVEVRGLRPDHLCSLVQKLREAGVQVEEGESWLRVRGERPLRAITVQALPYPGLATDLQAPMAALLTQAEGVSYVHERVFDNRLLYVAELRKMGAEVVTTGTTTAIITGPTPLLGTRVRALDVRAGAALILAGLVAHGRTEITDIYHVDRGYERIDEKLNALGAHVERVD